MKPEKYLTRRGKQYFKAIEKILSEKGIADYSYSIKLSMLANELAKYEECHLKAAEREQKGMPGFYNLYENGTVQVNAFFTIAKEAQSAIDKLSSKFGLTPLDFTKIKDITKAKETKDPLDGI